MGLSLCAQNIIITELLIDPSPSVFLPEFEFIELYNASTKSIELADFMISDGKTTVNLDSFELKSHAFLLLCKNENQADFMIYGAVMGLNSWPSLNNSSDSLRLLLNNKIVDQVNYNTDWYQESIKKEGGWTLERIDFNYPCNGSINWSASISSEGGTPGEINSVANVIVDLSPPKLEKSYPLDSFSYLLEFDEIIQLKVEKRDWKVRQNQIEIIWEQFLGEDVFKLTVANVQDCIGNTMQDFMVKVAYPSREISREDIRINEILFNPYSYSYDYVELFNSSSKTVLLSDLVIDNIHGDWERLNLPNQFLFPGDYLVLTEDRKEVLFQYPVNDSLRVFEIGNLPSFPDSSGFVVLRNQQLDMIDSVHYYEDWHFKNLKGEDGIALERISLDVNSNRSDNWISASHDSFYGTPGCSNSQEKELDIAIEYVQLESSYFSPDNDGVEDILSIYLNFPGNDYYGNISVYSKEGKLIKSILNHQFMGNGGAYFWNGNDDDGILVASDTYVILIEAYSNTHQKIKEKKACALLMDAWF